MPFTKRGSLSRSVPSDTMPAQRSTRSSTHTSMARRTGTGPAAEASRHASADAACVRSYRTAPTGEGAGAAGRTPVKHSGAASCAARPRHSTASRR